MKRISPGHRSPQLNQNKDGYVLMVIVLIMASVFSVVLIKITIQSIIYLETSTLEVQKTHFDTLQLSCIQENLLNLTRNQAYQGGTLDIFSGTCLSTINENGAYLEINMTTTQNELTDNIKVTFDPATKTIMAWDN